MKEKNKYFLFILISAFSFIGTQANATIIVYTDRSSWELATKSSNFSHFHYLDFEGAQPQAISNYNFPLLSIGFNGDPRFNVIDNSPSSILSPNGSTYYRGEIGYLTTHAELSIQELDYGVKGFGADWVVLDGSDLSLGIQGKMFSLYNYLPEGYGFLGFITDTPSSPFHIDLSGTAFFGMDNIQTASAPIPSSVWLFSSAIIGLIKPRKLNFSFWPSISINRS